LNNAYRHAGGAGQEVHASYDGAWLEVRVCDTGPGIASGSAPDAEVNPSQTCLGLAGMRYRVEALGGVFSIDSTVGFGTQVSARFKL
jgi:signal transduction histidine kinase